MLSSFPRGRGLQAGQAGDTNEAEGPVASLLRTATSGFLAPEGKSKPFLTQFTSQRTSLTNLLFPRRLSQSAGQGRAHPSSLAEVNSARQPRSSHTRP